MTYDAKKQILTAALAEAAGVPAQLDPGFQAAHDGFLAGNEKYKATFNEYAACLKTLMPQIKELASKPQKPESGLRTLIKKLSFSFKNAQTLLVCKMDRSALANMHRHPPSPA